VTLTQQGEALNARKGDRGAFLAPDRAMAEAVCQTWVCQARHCAENHQGAQCFCPTWRHVAVPQTRVRRNGVVMKA
jgi:hypothetical protein